MSTLEPPFGEQDPGGMAARVDGIAEQIEAAIARGATVPWKTPARMPSLVAVGAMGGSAIAAELTAALYADRLPRPIVVVRDYHWPAFVTRECVALLCSFSGKTEETLALYREAARRGVPRAAITSGGALAVQCDRDGIPWAKLPADLSPPRAALFAAWVPLTQFIHALEWCDDPLPDWRAAAARVREVREQVGTAVPESRNPAKQLARALVGRHLLIYSGPGPMAAVATRLRQQLNENAKLLGHSAVVPELQHNEIVGWERPDRFHRGASVLVLRDPGEAPEVGLRLDLTVDYARRQGAAVHELHSGAGTGLARMCAQIAWSDALSLYLALARGVDPTPIASIDEFKRRLAAAGAQGERD